MLEQFTNYIQPKVGHCSVGSSSCHGQHEARVLTFRKFRLTGWQVCRLFVSAAELTSVLGFERKTADEGIVQKIAKKLCRGSKASELPCIALRQFDLATWRSRKHLTPSNSSSSCNFSSPGGGLKKFSITVWNGFPYYQANKGVPGTTVNTGTAKIGEKTLDAEENCTLRRAGGGRGKRGSL